MGTGGINLGAHIFQQITTIKVIMAHQGGIHGGVLMGGSSWGGGPLGGSQFPIIGGNQNHNNQMGGQLKTLAASMYLGSYKPKRTPIIQNLILVVTQQK